MGEVKVRRLERRLGTAREEMFVVVYTDSHRDLALLDWADLGVAVNPTRELAAVAADRSMPVQDWDDGRGVEPGFEWMLVEIKRGAARAGASSEA
jgi:phosphoserine phosphatase